MKNAEESAAGSAEDHSQPTEIAGMLRKRAAGPMANQDDAKLMPEPYMMTEHGSLFTGKQMLDYGNARVASLATHPAEPVGDITADEARAVLLAMPIEEVSKMVVGGALVAMPEPIAWMMPDEIAELLKAASVDGPTRYYGRIYARQYDSDMVPVCAAPFESAAAPAANIEALRSAFHTYMACPTPRNYDALLEAIPSALEATQQPTTQAEGK